MSARTEMLHRIRAANAAATAGAVEIPRAYRRTRGVAPGSVELLELLQQRLEDYDAQVHRVSRDRLAERVRDLTAGRRFVLPEGLDRGWVEHAETDDGRFGATDLDSFDGVVTRCAAACAETGTIVLDGSAGQGRRAVSLVPDLHVCVVYAEQVVATVPELVATVEPTRPLTFVSGPSATSDIELDRVAGVHGPRTLVVVLAE